MAADQLSILHRRVILSLMLQELNERSREVFRYIVDAYLETGTPVGSRTIAKETALNLSPASIRNTMADLQELGLLASPHTSAGRIPTAQGLRLYVDGLMEVGALSEEDRRIIQAECGIKGLSPDDMMNRASALLSDLSSCASLVVAPKTDKKIKEIQLVPLDAMRILIVLVMDSGLIENRIMEAPSTFTQSALITASNYLNAKLKGKTLAEAQNDVLSEIQSKQTQLDDITQKLVRKGLALPPGKSEGHIIVRGQSRLLEDVKAMQDLERARTLLSYLEEQENIVKLLGSINSAQGVQIFIGTENDIFNQTGWSMILSPYKDMDEKIIGAIGVVGPTRLDYDRIIPMVDYTSKVIEKLVEEI